MSINLNKTTFQKLILVGSLVLFVLLLAFLFTGNYIKQTTEESIRQAEQNTMEQMVKKFEDYHQNMMQIATSLAYSPTVYHCFFLESLDRVMSNEAVSMVLSNTFLLDSSIADIFIYDMDMAQIAGAGKEIEELDELECLKEWQTQTVYSGLFELPITKTPCYALFFPVYKLESERFAEQIGLCVLVMKTQKLMEILSDAQLSSQEELCLIDADSQMLASFGGEDLSSGCQYTQTLAIGGWSLVLKRPDTRIFHEISREIGFIAVAYSLAAALVLWLLIICYRNLVRPIQEMDAFVRKVSFNPNLRMTVKSQNEIGMVEQGLNRMLDSMDQKNAQIQQMREWAYETELAKKQLQILVYRNQIHPHFLYNTLDCIRAMAVLNDQKPIAAIAMALSKMFRFAVKEENVITVEEEVNYIREYAKIIDYRFNGKIKIEMELEEAAATKPMIKMILQPIIENAVFHGLERKVGGGTVKASVRMADGNRLRLTVVDNGCGMSEETLKSLQNDFREGKKEGGIGLPNICHRLKLFYGEEMKFSIDSRENEGTTVKIEILDQVTDRGIVDVPDFFSR